MAQAKTFRKYGLKWPADIDLLEIEFYCIRNHLQYGFNLFDHYRNAQTLCWPDDDHHRWSDLGLKALCEEEITVFLGCADSNKTYLVSRFVMIDWWAHAENTIWLVSSTELRGAELRIWGKLKELFNRARKLRPKLPGRVFESLHCITNEEVPEDDDDERQARLLTKGIIFVPCKSSGRWVGMGGFTGIKPTKNGRLGHAGDEVSVMQRSFLDAYSNWYGKPNFKGIMSANPYDLEDPSCVAAEPVDGWASWRDNGKTQTWRSRFYNAFVIAFDGRDSPNNDPPINRFPYLVGPKKLEAVARSVGKDTWQYYSQCIGKPQPHSQARRVLSRQLCEEYRAFDDVVWKGSPTMKIASCDAAYGGVGGDRCAMTHVEIGEDTEGNTILCCRQVVIVPVSVTKKGLPEDQIAEFAMDYCKNYGIPPENFFFDARATLAISLSRTWSASVEAVDFGGKPSVRPVSLDTYIWDGSVQTRRLQRCDELYSKFVTELWFAVHYVILSGQMRQLPREVAEEGYKRQWEYVTNNRMEVETKADMKARTGESPDLMDCLVTAVEGARRRGFEIKRLANPEASSTNLDWLDRELKKDRQLNQGRQLIWR